MGKGARIAAWLGLVAGLAALPGCWPGRLMAGCEFPHRHPAVRWVYRTGGQWGWMYIISWPIRNCVHDLQLGRGCVIVKEGPLGCMEWGLWRPQYALDLKTGRFAFGRPTEKKWTYVSDKWDRPGNRFVFPIGEDIELRIPQPCRELHLGRPGAPEKAFVRLLALREGKESLGASMHAVRTRDVLVIGMFDGYVICLDLKKLPMAPKGP